MEVIKQKINKKRVVVTEKNWKSELKIVLINILNDRLSLRLVMRTVDKKMTDSEERMMMTLLASRLRETVDYIIMCYSCLSKAEAGEDYFFQSSILIACWEVFDDWFDRMKMIMRRCVPFSL